MATTCTDTTDLYEDVEFCQGKKALPGMRNHAYFIRKKNITAWPTLPATDSEGASLASIATYEGDFTLAADKKWNKIDLVPNENQPQAERAGAWGAYIFSNTAELTIPGTGAEVSGLIAMLNNDDCVFLLPQRDGQYRVFGNEAFNVDVAATQDWGRTSGDNNATVLTLTIEDELPAPFYPGKIETNDGDISGADGKVITPTA